MELTELVGRHIISGAEPGYETNTPGEWPYEDLPTLAFILDGKTFTAVEDPSDGYRSYLKEIREEGTCNNTFEGEEVNVEYADESQMYNHFQGIIVTIVATGQEVLRIGTNNYDDYYPYCVLEFRPQALAANQG